MSARPTRRRAVLGACGLAATAAGLGAFHALATGRGLVARSRVGLAFGTTISLTVAGTDPEAMEAALTEGMAAMRAVEHEASLFRRTARSPASTGKGGSMRPPAISPLCWPSPWISLPEPVGRSIPRFSRSGRSGRARPRGEGGPAMRFCGTA